MLRDEGNAVAHAYGLRFRLPDDLEQVYRRFGIDLPAVNGEGSWTLPMPARYVIDREGVVRSASVHPDYSRRPEPAETIEVLRALA
jgi:peroxiredoxin